jgi:hypothetical protein
MANELEQRARQLLSARLEAAGQQPIAGDVFYGREHPAMTVAIRTLAAALQQAQQPGAQAVAIEPEPDLDAHDPKSGELVAQWLFRNGFRELAAVVRAQLDMRAPRKAPPPLPEGVSEVAALLLEWCAVKAWLAADDFDSPERGMRERLDQAAAQSERWLESYRARLAAKAGGDRAG